MAYVIGVLSALAALALFGGGVLTGWKLRKLFTKVEAAPDPGEEARRQAREEQKAFDQLQNYNIEDAYNMKKKSLLRGDFE